jgi:hypothetical protein
MCVLFVSVGVVCSCMCAFVCMLYVLARVPFLSSDKIYFACVGFRVCGMYDSESRVNVGLCLSVQLSMFSCTSISCHSIYFILNFFS